MVLSLSVRVLVALLLLTAPLSCCAETVLLCFSSPTCGPCQQMKPTVDRLITDGLPVRKVDISRESQLAAQFGVTQVPTFLVVSDGRVVNQTVGVTSYRQLHRMVRRALPTPAPRQPARPLGQSPVNQSPAQQPAITSTFATQPAGIAAASGNVSGPPSVADLSTPQAGRVISLQDSTRPPARPTAMANPFPTRPATPNAGSPNPLHQKLINATVKLSVNDPQGQSVGTGTIVDARGGEALILTCGHIFRSSAGKGQITVTTFRASPSGATAGPTHAGQLIDFDLDRDLALVSIRTASPVQAVSIAGKTSTPLATNTPVTSVGCNNGQNATAIDSRVVSIDRYEGTPNVEVAGAPVEGRSGGGLFNAQGQLVGVCYAADPQANEGLYAGLPAIYAKLDSLRLTMIYDASGSPTTVAQATPPRPAPSRVAPQPTAPAPPITSVRGQEPTEVPSFGSTSQALAATLPPAEQAALEEIQRRGVNSEVICIIRPQDPTGKSEVITLNNASPAFVQALANRRSQQTPTQRLQR